MTWIDKFKEHLVTNTTLSEATIDQHASRLRSFAAWLLANVGKGEFIRGNVERSKKYGLPAIVDSALVRRYFIALSKKHSADYRQHIKSALRYYYAWLSKIDAIKEVPNLDIPIRKNGHDRGKDQNVLNEKDMAALRRYFDPGVDATDREIRNNLIFQILINLGIRKGELLMLRYSDFDIDIGQVSIRSTKTEGKSKYGGARIMPLSPSLNRLVTEFKNGASDSDTIIKIGGYTVWQMVKEAGVALGINWLKPHAFRHYCVTKFGHLVGADGVTPVFNWKEMSMMFGMSPEVIAARYDHPSPENIVSKALKSGVYSDEQ